MITKRQYVEHLLATPGNYTCSHLAEYLPGRVSYDVVSDYLQRAQHTARGLWELARQLIHAAGGRCDGYDVCAYCFDRELSER